MESNSFEGITGQLFGGMLQQLQSYHDALYPAIMDHFGIFIRAFVILYLVIAGIGIMTGYFRQATREVLISAVLVTSLHAFIMESNVYSAWIIKPFVGSFYDLGTFFVAKAGDFNFKLTGLFSSLDLMLDMLVQTINKLEPTGNILTNAWLHMKAAFAIGILFAVFGFLYGAYMAILIIGFFSMYILFVIGGICLFFAAFKQTRFIAWSWFKGIMNYGLLIVFSSIVLSICLFTLNNALGELVESANLSKDVFTFEYFKAVFWAIITIVMILKTPDLAAILTGTYPGSTSGIAAGLGTAMSSVAIGFKKIANYPRRGAAAVGGIALQNLKGDSWHKAKGFER